MEEQYINIFNSKSMAVKISVCNTLNPYFNYDECGNIIIRELYKKKNGDVKFYFNYDGRGFGRIISKFDLFLKIIN